MLYSDVIKFGIEFLGYVWSQGKYQGKKKNSKKNVFFFSWFYNGKYQN